MKLHITVLLCTTSEEVLHSDAVSLMAVGPY